MADGKKPELKKDETKRNLKILRQGVGAKKVIKIETNGSDIHIAEMTVSPLEACEIFRRLMKEFGGN